MVLKLYLHEVSPGVRATLLTAAALGVEINEKIPVDLLNGEHFGAEYTERHPAQTVPSLDDDGFIVNDSHVIVTYLVEKYGKDDSLYPKDIQKRSRVNYILHYDNGILFPALYSTAMKIYKFVSKTTTEDDMKLVMRAYNILERLLKGQAYAAGDFLSVGDLCLIPTMSSMNFLVPVDPDKFPNITTWMEKMKQLPYYHHNQYGLEKHMALLEEFKNKFDSSSEK